MRNPHRLKLLRTRSWEHWGGKHRTTAARKTIRDRLLRA